MSLKKEPIIPERIIHLGRILSSHITHELASPLSAILTGLEVLLPALKEEREVFDLVQRSAITLKERLSCLRCLYGVSGKDITWPQAQGILEQWINLKKNFTLRWSVKGNLPAAPEAAPPLLVLALAFWMSTCGLRGGVLEVHNSSARANAFHLSLHAPSGLKHQEKTLFLEPDLKIETIEPSHSLAYWIALLCLQYNQLVLLESWNTQNLCLCTESKR